MNSTIVSDLNAVSPATEVTLHYLEPRDPWNFEEVFECLYDFSKAYPFDPDEEDYLVHITTGTHVAQICLFLLTESRHFPGRILQLSPPKRRQKEDLDPGKYNIIDLDLSRYDKLAARFEKEAEDSADFLKSGIKTRNARFNHMIERIEQVAIRSTAPMLLTGPTGAGKSQLARRIFELKSQKGQISGPFVEINCSTLKGDTAMSTLFGHRKGAFTGAATHRPGLLKTADKGVLFLDEIGELGADEQSMLLRAIEEKRFLPVGSDKEETSHFQLISGTNRDLIKNVADGSFRADLFARINLWLFEMPGLNERPEDIEPNIAFELEKFSQDSGRDVSFNREANDTFLKFAKAPSSLWTGNFRDLNAAITRMATLSGNSRINSELVAEETDRLKRLWSANSNTSERRTRETLESALESEEIELIDRFDQVQLAEVIRTCRESRTLSEAGRKLFASSRIKRKTANDSDRVRKYLGKYGLDWKSITTQGETENN